MAKVLEGYGHRVQFSVFECILDTANLDTLVGRLRYELRATERGNVRIYRLCGHCETASLGLGEFVETDGDGPALILRSHLSGDNLQAPGRLAKEIAQRLGINETCNFTASVIPGEPQVPDCRWFASSGRSRIAAGSRLEGDRGATPGEASASP
jgi:CRISPR-associated protein Cas2